MENSAEPSAPTRRARNADASTVARVLAAVAARIQLVAGRVETRGHLEPDVLALVDEHPEDHHGDDHEDRQPDKEE